MKTNLRLIGGKKLQSPNNSYTRPTTLRVREAIFNILNNRVKNSNWLDLLVGLVPYLVKHIIMGQEKLLLLKKTKTTQKFAGKIYFRCKT